MSEDNSIGGVVHEQVMPLEWQQHDAFPEDLDIIHQHDANLTLLHTINVIESKPVENDDSEMQSDVVRLENKVDLVLDLLSSLIRQTRPLPPNAKARLGGEGMEWASGEEAPLPAAGSKLTVSFHLNKMIPSPIVLWGEVVDVALHDSARWATLRFGPMSQQFEQAWVKLIFRHHRRAIAMARANR
ncbi:hypothetical protein BOW53_00630 [Solemya pervernicosa gill symbiont]|uniref:Cyclic di-GMP receptor atypical PilZ domain-containing protein n=1 Tax=Solemya pervernicosa gill symbiont TaxID=642797 RepID=A0A1T2LAI7_9GAMM|nr:PilZ domain-containing protein [Solemya pervernicosa gill symbiont]OOZ42119.1 hypothetical protein BOW53_00630 [Solemya pervernicosa gill symbiont]